MSELSHLNIFNAYSAGLKHENNLTRAFILVLKNNPFIFQRFIGYIERNYLENNIESLTDAEDVVFLTQVTGDLSEHSCDINIPLLITEEKVDNIPQPESVEIDGYTIPDGFISVKPNLAISIEVKKHSNVRWKQVYGHLNVLDPHRKKKQAINITWKEIVSLLNDSINLYQKIYDHEGSFPGAEANIIEDFIKYITIYHPNLTPYESLEECRGNELAYNKYLSVLLQQLDIGQFSEKKDLFIYIDNKEVKKWVERFYLNMSEDLQYIYLNFYPGDTTSQAYNLYKKLQFNHLKNIVMEGWEVTPILHFAYIGTQLVFADTDIDWEDYVKYWIKNADKIRQYKEHEFEDLYQKLLDANLISKSDKLKLIEKFTDTKREHINLSPGFKLSYRLSVKQAMDLEKEDRLLSYVGKKVHDVYYLTE